MSSRPALASLSVPARLAALAITVAISVAAAAGCVASSAAPAAPTSAHTAAPAPGASLCSATIARVWHGRTPVARTDEYAAYITAAITKFRDVPGNRGYQLLRETIGDDTHFTVISYWTSRDAIRAYAGDDIRKTRHLPRDAELLIEPEQTVKNYELLVQSLDCPQAP